MSKTFKALCDYAEWSALALPEHMPKLEEAKPDVKNDEKDFSPQQETRHTKIKTPELHYNIQIHLPESRDPSVYDAIFKSLKEHFN